MRRRETRGLCRVVKVTVPASMYEQWVLWGWDGTKHEVPDDNEKCFLCGASGITRGCDMVSEPHCEHCHKEKCKQ